MIMARFAAFAKILRDVYRNHVVYVTEDLDYEIRY